LSTSPRSRQKRIADEDTRIWVMLIAAMGVDDRGGGLMAAQRINREFF